MSYTRLDTDSYATNVSSSVDKRSPSPRPYMPRYATDSSLRRRVSKSYLQRGALHLVTVKLRFPTLDCATRQVSLAQVDYLGKFRIAQVLFREEIVEFKGRRDRYFRLDIFWGGNDFFFFLSLKQRRFGQRGFVQPLSNFVFPIGSLIILIQL